MLPHMINALSPNDSSDERVPTFSKLMIGLGIIEGANVEELTLSEMEEIEASQSEIQGVLDGNGISIEDQSAAAELGFEVQSKSQFNNISTGDFVLDDQVSETERMSEDLSDLDLGEQ